MGAEMHSACIGLGNQHFNVRADSVGERASFRFLPLTHDVRGDLSMDIGQTKIATSVSVGQLLVIEPH